MPRHARLHALISRLERMPDGQGFLLAFYAPRSKATFEAARVAVAELPVQDRRYIPDMRCWLVSAAAILTLVSRWPMLAEALALLEERAQYQRQYEQSDRRSSSRAPRSPVMPPTVADAYDRLYLRPGAPLELVQAARKAYAKLHHPDLGAQGDGARLAALNDACDVVEAYTREVVVSI